MELFSCRICLLYDDVNLISLFLVNNDKSYAEMVNFSTGIGILKNDGFPQKICVDCLAQIQISFKVKQKSIDSDCILRQNVKISSTAEETLVIALTENLDFVEYEIDENDLKNSDRLNEKRNKISHNDKEMIVKTPISKIKTDPWHRQCFICNKKFKTFERTSYHIKSIHRNATNCTICDKKMKTAMTLNDHIMFHIHGHSSICDFCGKGFQLSSKLLTHIKRRHLFKNKLYICDLCGVTMRFRPNIVRHMSTVHMKLKKFKCTQCEGSEYTTQVGLNFHLYSCHNVEAPIKCPACNMGFTYNSELRGHLKNLKCSDTIRTSGKRTIKNYFVKSQEGLACSYCSKISSDKRKAAMHFCQFHKTSNDCKQCGKSFNNSSNLRRHVRQNHENNYEPFKCEICDKTFLQKHTLEAHRNTHTGAKPYSCDLCSFKAGDRSTISKHKKNVHKKKK